MGNTAILIGNSEYRSLQNLPCCREDVKSIWELLDGTQKYTDIPIIENYKADNLKSAIRNIVEKQDGTDELFLYYTGHGCQLDDDFYYCAPEFDSSRPNQTGLSTNELHALLRLANANLVVKVIDACNSGTLLVKSDGQFQSNNKDGFNNLIQISACRETQFALTGEPLSAFTERFTHSALRKTEGSVYYIDIVSTLKDEFIGNNDQTPFFVFQVTGREKFVHDDRQLDALRARLAAHTQSVQQLASEGEQTVDAPVSLETLLEMAEKDSATPEAIQSFTGGFFDNLIDRASRETFSDFFDLKIYEHANFSEITTEAFVARVLSKQDRIDEFVTVRTKREKVSNPFERLRTTWVSALFGNDETFREIYDLELNCEMKRAQIKLELTPKYRSLKKLSVVVTCAPSLQHCYIFEMGTQHSLTDFNEFGEAGDQVVRRWYKLLWKDDSSGVVEKITLKLLDVVRTHLEDAKRRLVGDAD